ncbi:MAG: flavin reductase family protein [Longimicrobiales bacterium]
MTQHNDPLDPTLFRRIMGHYPTGVTVVTALAEPGSPVGFTANSVTSVSLDPPLVLVCISKESASLGAISGTGGFAVNILDASSAPVASQFAKGDREERFKGVASTPRASGIPVLDGALAWLECELYRAFEAGDHMILVGQVQAGGAMEGEPLLFYKGQYGRLSP